MIKKFKLTALLTTAALWLNICAYVASAEVAVDFDLESETFTIEGVCASKKDNVPVSLNIFHPDSDTEDLFSLGKTPFETMAFHDQILTADGGKYLFKATPEGKTGDYICYIKAGDDEKIRLTLSFVNKTEAKDAIEDVNDLTTPQDIADYMSVNIQKLGIDCSVYNSVSKTEIAQKILNERARSGKLDLADIEETVKILNVLVVAQALEENKTALVDNIFDEKYVFSEITEDERIAKWYEAVISENPYMQKEMTNRVYGKASSEISGFINNVIEAVVLEIIENPNGYENTKAVISDFAYEIGITNPVTADSVYRSLTGNNYNTLGDLYSAYINFDGGKQESPYQPSGGGGGGGRGGSSSTVIKVENTIDAPVEAVPLKTYSFKDTVSVEWAYDAIEYLYEKEIVSGKTKDTFCPNDSVKREEFVKLLVEAFDYSYTNNSLAFTDVKKGEWYENYVKAAYQNGIVKGKNVDCFGVGENITRQDIAVMIMNVINKNGITLADVNEKADFSDSNRIADYAKEAVIKLQKAGIINGLEDNTFRPDESATRAQAAVMIYRTIVSAGLYEKGGE